MVLLVSLLLPLYWGCLLFVSNVVLGAVLSGFAITLLRKRELFALLMSSCCLFSAILSHDAVDWSEVCGFSLAFSLGQKKFGQAPIRSNYLSFKLHYRMSEKRLGISCSHFNSLHGNPVTHSDSIELPYDI